MTISERIARNARVLCKERKIPISDLENQIGVSPGYLSRITGKRMLSIDLGNKIADFLAMGMEELIRYDPVRIAREKRIAELKAELAELEGETNG